VEVELHERAKEALGEAGQPAARAIVGVFKAAFVKLPGDSTAAIVEKILARKAAFSVLAKIGRPAYSPVRNFLLKDYLPSWRFNPEHPTVIEAAKAAATAIGIKVPGF
jgi:hypothetical protein